MNKNTIIGITLIGLLLIGFSVYNSRIAREQQEIQRVRDSVAAAQAFEYAEEMARQMAADSASAGQGTQDGQPAYASTYANPFLEQAYNAGEDFHYLENNKLRIKYSTKGGQAASVLIKDYYTSDSTDLYLMKDDYSDFGLQLYTDQYINTGGFTYETVVSNDSTLVMRLYFSDTAFIEHRYFLPADSYMVDFDVHMVNMDRHIPRNASQFEIAWNMDVPRLERGYKNEQNYSTVDFKYPGQVKFRRQPPRGDHPHRMVRLPAAVLLGHSPGRGELRVGQPLDEILSRDRRRAPSDGLLRLDPRPVRARSGCDRALRVLLRTQPFPYSQEL